MAVISFLVFGAAFAASAWTLWATVAPQAPRIRDLLGNGPVALPSQAAYAPARSVMRDVRVRRSSAPSPQRAAA
ncbi:hypothetical protein M9980_05085 [Sphingomonas donggukensis]|uniref:Uncharacterized protein n=1 Tax=Sphingomonas donggukensis TaxID=2949093 RepID=A0ABY4TW07_9SPHN|nr:hypothetical protein [Sphingomonas donggukensis]URW76589.1 hypothetical protein M9980_05085 [Sphingomonas donggukensis]